MENMKILLEKDTDVSVHCFHHYEQVELTAEGFKVDGLSYEPNDINILTSTIVENVSIPDDWYGRKYLYQNNQWIINPDDPMTQNPVTEDLVTQPT
jgi:hypothetical protein